MLKTDEAFSRSIQSRVEAIEARSSAEVVVVAVGRSSQWFEIPLIAGMLAAWICLAFLCWSPYEFDANWMPFDVAAVGGLVGMLARKLPLIRWIPLERRRKRVREAAEACFVQESIHGTADRTGILVYISVAEDLVELLPDQGILGKVPGSEWNRLELDTESLEVLERGMGQMGELLAHHLPRGSNDRNELPDAPKVRP